MEVRLSNLLNLEKYAVKKAVTEDIQTLVALMTAFYAESHYQLDQEFASLAFADALSGQRHCHIWIIESDEVSVGYVLLSLRFAMEYGGMIGHIDDLYIAPEQRSKGLSTALLETLRGFCVQQKVCALTVEVAHDNAAAQAAYRRLGMLETADRQVLSVALARASHVA